MHKISIIAPAYQAEEFIQRYIDCILNLDYKNLQLIIINDGSTDNTNNIIENNRSTIISKGIEFIYINLVENKGQAFALNLGLKYVTGAYLSWHDVDDIFESHCLSKCLELALKNPECKTIFSKAAVINENGTSITKGNKELFIPEKDYVHKNLFLDYIYGHNVIYGPLRFVETETLFKVLKDKSIYMTSGGQNLQIFLPMVYAHDWIYTDEVLSKYIIRGNSHSRCIKREERIKTRFYTLINTIFRMKIPLIIKLYYCLFVIHKLLFKDCKLLRININPKRRIFKLHLLNKEILNFCDKKSK